MMKVIESNSPLETSAFAKELSPQVSNGGVITLKGDLGSGKTTFTQALLKHLGVNEVVQSPTFVIQKQYIIRDKQLTIYHFDLYRLNTINEILGVGIEDTLSEKEALVIIEWPELVASLVPENTYRISFEYLSDLKRKITLE